MLLKLLSLGSGLHMIPFLPAITLRMKFETTSRSLWMKVSVRQPPVKAFINDLTEAQ